MTTWIQKAHRIIATEAQRSYDAANIKHDGTKRKKHVPYTLPSWVDDLINAMNRDDEETGKAIFQNHAFGACGRLD